MFIISQHFENTYQLILELNIYTYLTLSYEYLFTFQSPNSVYILQTLNIAGLGVFNLS